MSRFYGQLHEIDQFIHMLGQSIGRSVHYLADFELYFLFYLTREADKLFILGDVKTSTRLSTKCDAKNSAAIEVSDSKNLFENIKKSRGTLGIVKVDFKVMRLGLWVEFLRWKLLFVMIVG